MKQMHVLKKSHYKEMNLYVCLCVYVYVYYSIREQIEIGIPCVCYMQLT